MANVTNLANLDHRRSRFGLPHRHRNLLIRVSLLFHDSSPPSQNVGYGNP
jgi:hypothetical protein